MLLLQGDLMMIGCLVKICGLLVRYGVHALSRLRPLLMDLQEGIPREVIKERRLVGEVSLLHVLLAKRSLIVFLVDYLIH